jgi:ABC-2 type transport system permease protein
MGQALPLTHALQALRGALLAGASPAALRGPLTALAVFAAVLIPAGVGAFAYALRRARIDGSLSHY